MRRLLLPALLLAAAVAVPAFAASSSRGLLWATVNVCNSASAPRSVGFRASIPGDTSQARTYVRFTAQWLDPRTRSWAPVEGVPTSPWLGAGSAGQLAGQVGWTFEFEQPAAGAAFQVRGLAELQWRRGASLVRSQTLVTSGGRAGVDEGAPPATSLASCSLR
jgi:hypothetical protein